MNFHAPQVSVASVPKRLAITPTMVQDFLVDPVLGLKVIMGVTLDAFQKHRMRTYWWVPNVIDSSGFGTGKSFVFWCYMNLRALLIPGQRLVAYYQSFGAGKDIFWPNYENIYHPIFEAQKGSIDFEGKKDKKDNQNMPECWHQHYKTGSHVMMPAPGWLKNAIGEAGKTFHRAGVDEFTKIERLGKHAGSGRTVEQRTGIDDQILGRLRAPSFNQYHPLWGNGIIFLATAESQSHPSWTRVKQFQDEIRKGNPDYALFTSCYKDFSNQPCFLMGENDRRPFKEAVPNWATINRMKKRYSKSHVRREIYGLWARDTKGWYSDEALARCVQLGVGRNLQPEIARNKELKEAFYFLGEDPAPALGKRSDDGALAVLRAQPRTPGEYTNNPADWWLEFVWAYRLRGANIDQWSGFTHLKHEHFSLSGILLDAGAGGGGTYVMQKLAQHKQLVHGIEKMCQPICTLEDTSAPDGNFLLNMFWRRDPGIQALWSQNLRNDSNLPHNMHVAFQQAVEHGMILWPRPFNERPRSETEGWSLEQQWALKVLDQGREQLMNIHVATKEDGTWITNMFGAMSFEAVGKKDIAYAKLMAYTRFLIWLRMGVTQSSGADAGMCYSM